jgi:hypothetical protein
MKYLPLILVLFLLSCKKGAKTYNVPIVEMSDAEYPDNPNLTSRHSSANQDFMNEILIKNLANGNIDIEVSLKDKSDGSIKILNFSVLEMMPTAIDGIKSDEYLTYLAIINQEWNRQQVQLAKDQFEIIGNSDVKITRVDIARNCLNAYLWEVIIYAQDTDGTDKIYSQGWFNFPKEKYKELFEVRNNLKYAKFEKPLENWIDPPSKKINYEILRKVTSTKELKFVHKNDEMYPKKGERERKYKNITTPTSVTKISDLLSDSTSFATFSIPGYYNKKDPRKTELGKLATLVKVTKHDILDILGKKSIELELTFEDANDTTKITRFIIGGMKIDAIPTLKPEDANNGWQTSMGIANHSFYETLEYQQKNLTKNNGFYCFLSDENDQWLDSHKIGIDGPLLHFDNLNPNLLHIWILSFERHAFVGHYTILL